MSSADFIVREWDPFAEACAAAGFRVLLPNFHSNPRTAPGLIRGVGEEDVNKLLETVISQSKDPVILMGKSWGGAMAAKFAQNHSEMVRQLVLVCPALASGEVAKDASGKTVNLTRKFLLEYGLMKRHDLLVCFQRNSWYYSIVDFSPQVRGISDCFVSLFRLTQDLCMPLLLMWAKDDWITWFSGTKVYQQNCPNLTLQVGERGGHRILPDYLQPLLSFVQAKMTWAPFKDQGRAALAVFVAEPVEKAGWTNRSFKPDGRHPLIIDLWSVWLRPWLKKRAEGPNSCGPRDGGHVCRLWMIMGDLSLRLVTWRGTEKMDGSAGWLFCKGSPVTQ